MIHPRWRLVKHPKGTDQWMVCKMCGRIERSTEGTARCPRGCEREEYKELTKKPKAPKAVSGDLWD